MNKELKAITLAAAEFFARLGAVLVSLAKEMDEGVSSAPQKDDKPAPAKRGRKPKQEPEMDMDEEEEISDDDAEEEEELEGEEEDAGGEDFDEEEEESDTIGEAELKKLKAALKNFSAKNSKGAAVKLLMKYAKTSDQVKKADYPKLMKALK